MSAHDTHTTPQSDPQRTIVFGVLGGVASGKSEVARRLVGVEGLVLSADEFAQEALDEPEIQATITDAFGPRAVDANGRTDRAFLAGLVFEDAAARARLEGWIHPRVRDRIMSALTDARQRAVPRIALDVPLLFENDEKHRFTRECDHLVFVEVSDAERERRALEHRGWQAGEVARRESAQMDLAEKKQRANFVVQNEGSLEELDRALASVLARTLAQ
jgi:dephospho-CoA kinase